MLSTSKLNQLACVIIIVVVQKQIAETPDYYTLQCTVNRRLFTPPHDLVTLCFHGWTFFCLKTTDQRVKEYYFKCSPPCDENVFELASELSKMVNCDIIVTIAFLYRAFVNKTFLVLHITVVLLNSLY